MKNKIIHAIIPARGGSKRIPNKNIRLYGGKPLIYWSIKLALSCQLINRVIVSTDSPKIATIARECGADVPFLRPNDISADLSTDYECLEHYLQYAKNSDSPPDILVHLRPTYPNRKLEVLVSCIDTFCKDIDTYDSLRTVCEMDKPAFKMYTINGDILTPLFNSIGSIREPYNQPAQILPKTYWHNGYIDIIKSETILDKKSVTGDTIYPYIMDKDEIDDIDTIEEWIRSEQKFDHRIL